MAHLWMPCWPGFLLPHEVARHSLWAVGLVALLLLGAWHDSLPLPLPLLTALFLPGLVAVCVEGGLMS